MEDLFQSVALPDGELVDLIEQAFLEGQIDGVKAELAYWLIAPRADLPEVCASN